MRYAQVDLETGICFSVSDLSGTVVAPGMIPVADEDFPLGMKYEAGKWVEMPVVPSTPMPTLEHRLDATEAAITELILKGVL